MLSARCVAPIFHHAAPHLVVNVIFLYYLSFSSTSFYFSFWKKGHSSLFLPCLLYIKFQPFLFILWMSVDIFFLSGTSASGPSEGDSVYACVRAYVCLCITGSKEIGRKRKQKALLDATLFIVSDALPKHFFTAFYLSLFADFFSSLLSFRITSRFLTRLSEGYFDQPNMRVREKN